MALGLIENQEQLYLKCCHIDVTQPTYSCLTFLIPATHRPRVVVIYTQGLKSFRKCAELIRVTGYENAAVNIIHVD
jgi:hypothetical protein